MKRPIAITTFIAFGLVTTLAAVASESLLSVGNQEEGTSAVLEISPAKSRTSFPGSAEYFTGAVAVDMLFQPNDTRNASAATVEFTPGARTAWHTHPAGQTLVVTSGTGWVQTWGNEKQVMKQGDVVWIPAGVKHWHGATATNSMTHLAIQERLADQVVEWMEQVNDEQYQSAASMRRTKDTKGTDMAISTTKQSKAASAPQATWDKTFPKSDRVSHEKVSYRNRFGIEVAADMYLPKDIDKSAGHAAIVVGTPYGGVKEQGAGIYAQTLAERGFVTIAFDESYNGESGGEPRRVSSPDIFVEDFSAGVDFLGSRTFVDRDRIGAIGICGSGAFSLTAAQVDHRIKAVATLSMYDMSRVKSNGWMDGMTKEQRSQHLDQLAEQRWKDVDAGSPELTPSFPAEPAGAIPEGLDPITSEFFEYYAMERGFHPRSIAAFTVTSDMSFMNFPLLDHIETISPRPILFIMGENAHSRYFTEDAYKMAAEPKELYVVPGARHIDLYDRTDMIPFDKLASFFGEHLK